jgi:hypothetical protein
LVTLRERNCVCVSAQEPLFEIVLEVMLPVLPGGEL